MIAELPAWLDMLFLCTTLATLVLFYFANNKPTKLLLGIIAWGILHSILAYSGFYQNTTTMPPRFGIMLIPLIIIISYGLLPKQRVYMTATRNPVWSTLVHTVRIPVEITLLYLFLNGAVPELMTFEGRNFDILAGITAPIIAFLQYRKSISREVLLAWNIVCLGLVLFIVVNAILSVAFPFQQFGFDQPNVAILHFPYVLLPGIVVPLVIYTHLSDIIRLWKSA